MYETTTIGEPSAPQPWHLTIMPPDIGALAEKDQATFQKVCEDVEQIASVREAREKHETAVDRLAKLQAAYFQINKRGKALGDRVTAARAALEDGIIESYIGGESVDAAALFMEFTAAQGESGALTRALERLCMHVTPLAEIARLKAEADLLTARGAELKRIATERITKTAEMLRDAAEFESGLTIDTRSTLTGKIMDYAASLVGQGARSASQAQEQEIAYRRANVAR